MNMNFSKNPIDRLFTNNSARFMNSTGKDTPWKGLGHELTIGGTPEQHAQESHLNFTLEKTHIQFWNGNNELVDMPDNFVLYRSDTNEALSTVTSKYNEVQPLDMLNIFHHVSEIAGFIPMVGGASQGGRKYWILAKLKNDTDLDITDKDKGTAYALMGSSCDKSSSSFIKIVYIREICTNTLTIIQANQTFKIPHSTTFDAHKIKTKMGFIDEKVHENVNTFRHLHKTSITMEDATKFFINLLISPDERKSQIIDRDKLASKTRTLNKIIESYQTAPGNEPTLWGAVNAVTHAVDYNPSARSDDSRLTSAWFATGDTLKSEAYALAQDATLLDQILGNTQEKGNLSLSNILDMVQL